MNTKNNLPELLAPRQPLPPIIDVSSPNGFNVIKIVGEKYLIFCKRWYKVNGIIQIEDMKTCEYIHSDIYVEPRISTDYYNYNRLHKEGCDREYVHYGKTKKAHTVPESKFESASSFESKEELIENNVDCEWMFKDKEQALVEANDRQTEVNKINCEHDISSRIKEKYIELEFKKIMDKFEGLPAFIRFFKFTPCEYDHRNSMRDTIEVDEVALKKIIMEFRKKEKDGMDIPFDDVIITLDKNKKAKPEVGNVKDIPVDQ